MKSLFKPAQKLFALSRLYKETAIYIIVWPVWQDIPLLSLLYEIAHLKMEKKAKILTYS